MSDEKMTITMNEGWQGGWFVAPQDRALTPEERLNCVKRRFLGSNFREVVLYKHGTIILRLHACGASTDDVLRCYNVPLDGEGGAPGDICPEEYDDGSIAFLWEPPVKWGGPDGGLAMTIFGRYERGQTVTPPASETEVHLVVGPGDEAGTTVAEDLARRFSVYNLGRAARRSRSLDAREPKEVARWVPEGNE